jgi:hypothetical protein
MTVRSPSSAILTTLVRQPTPRATRRPAAIRTWALIGGAVLIVIVVGLLRWLSSDDRRRTNPGVDHYPFMVVLRVTEVLSAALLLTLFLVLVVRPAARDRRLGFDGMLLVGCLLVHFIDPVFNYFSPTFLQNSHSVQWGSWANLIPGYASPSGTAGFVEGILWAAALYGLFGVVAAYGGCAVLTRLRHRWPQLSNFSHYAILFAIFCVLDLIVENFFVRSQIYVFWGAYSPLTLWAGKLYQFPSYETVLAVIYAIGFVWLRDSRDPDGYSAVERGANDLGVLRRFSTSVRFLAITGFCLVWAMVSYFMPFNWLAMMSDSYPTLPSYLQGGAFCGTATRHACPSQYLHELKLTYPPHQQG